jgi:hypothetical protein
MPSIFPATIGFIRIFLVLAAVTIMTGCGDEGKDSQVGGGNINTSGGDANTGAGGVLGSIETPVIDSIVEEDGAITINYSHPGPYDSAQFFNNGLPIGTGAWDDNADRTKIISGLANGDTYNISMKVYLWSPDRKSKFSNVVSATPSAPGGSGAGPQIGSFSLSWTAPTTRTDGSPISLSEIDGYRVYYGSTQGDYPDSVDINDGSASSATISGVPAGDYYIVMTTYDSDGRESSQSGAVLKQAI